MFTISSNLANTFGVGFKA
ncbi:MAG: hypothetical protein JHC33_12200 [Ignisphaera sp.]|nr:hypothetical protein [Ignisphaera sp.]